MAENSSNVITETPTVVPTDLTSKVAGSGDDPHEHVLDSLPSSSANHSCFTSTLGHVDTEHSGLSTTNSTPEIRSIPNDTGQEQQQEPVHRKIFQVTRVLSASSTDGGDNVGCEKHELVTDVSQFQSDLLDTRLNLNPASSSSAMRSSGVISDSLQQYGLAIIDDVDLNDQHSNNNFDSSSVMNDDDHVQNRFKVVKVVSTDPLKKGRWECMDYFDQTMSTAYTCANSSNTVVPSSSPTQQSQLPQFPLQQQPQTPPLQSPQQPQSLPNLHQPHQQITPQLQQQQSETLTQPTQPVYSQAQTTTSIHPVIQGSQGMTQQQPMGTSQPQSIQSHQVLAQTPLQQQGQPMPTMVQQQQQFLQQQQQSLPPPSQQQQQPPRASGANAVAIDNKIEQAMDLVKSHLMFAVREEVEVLKEKISELMERISQLEYENAILKANATTETLAQLTSSSKFSGGNS